LRNDQERSRNTFTVGNGNRPGLTPERGQAPGNRHLTRVLGTGGRRVAPGGPGYRQAWRDEPGGAPSISYMEGAPPFCRYDHCAWILPPANAPSAIDKDAGRNDVDRMCPAGSGRLQRCSAANS